MSLHAHPLLMMPLMVPTTMTSSTKPANRLAASIRCCGVKPGSSHAMTAAAKRPSP